MSSCIGITFLTDICRSLVDYFALVGSKYSRDLGDVTNTITVVTSNFSQSLYIQVISRIQE